MLEIAQDHIRTDVAENTLKGKPAAINDIVLPANIVKGDGIDVLVEDERKGDGEVEDGEALGTNGEGQDLNGIGDDKGRESYTEIQVS